MPITPSGIFVGDKPATYWIGSHRVWPSSPPPDPDPLGFVGGDMYGAAGNSTAGSVTIPHEVQNGDLGIILLASANSGDEIVTAGWTEAAARQAGNSFWSKMYTRALASSDGGATVETNTTANQKWFLSLTVWRSAEIDAIGSLAFGPVSGTDAAATATPASPSVNASDAGETIVALHTRTSSPPTSFDRPSGTSTIHEAYDTGGGATCGNTSQGDTPHSSGAVSPGGWTMRDASNDPLTNISVAWTILLRTAE